jgi:hypothetical protein
VERPDLAAEQCLLVARLATALVLLAVRPRVLALALAVAVAAGRPRRGVAAADRAAGDDRHAR